MTTLDLIYQLNGENGDIGFFEMHNGLETASYTRLLAAIKSAGPGAEELVIEMSKYLNHLNIIRDVSHDPKTGSRLNIDVSDMENEAVCMLRAIEDDPKKMRLLNCMAVDMLPDKPDLPVKTKSHLEQPYWISFNPFGRVFVTKHSPFSEILRHDLWGKIKDTFNVIFGQVDDNENCSLGILDYLSCGLLTIPLVFFHWCANTKYNNRLANFLYFPAVILFAISLIPRLILSAILVTALLPIITVVHAISYFLAKDDLKTALTLSVSMERSNNGGLIEDEVSLEQALRCIQDNESARDQDGSIIGESAYTINQLLRDNLLGPTHSGYHRITGHNINGQFVISSVVGKTEQQRCAQKALLRLNLFHFTEQAEKIGSDPLLTANLDIATSRF